MKKIIIVIVIILTAIFAFWKITTKPNIEPAIKSTQKTQTTCTALKIINPQPNEQVASDFTVKVVVDNTNPKCQWTVFEAQAGTINVVDSNGNTAGNGILKTSDNWMTKDPVTYSGTVSLNTNIPHGKLQLIINEKKPNGNQGQTISIPIQY
jgi:hypothetical protein